MLTLIAVCAAGDGVAVSGTVRPESAGEAKGSPQVDPDGTIDFGRLLLERPPVPLTRVRDAKPPETVFKLPRDGSIVEDRKCRIVFRPETGWYLLKFLDEAEGGDNLSRWVLQSETLAAIKPRIDAGDGIFRVTGETTVYRKRLFILLMEISSAKPQKEPPPPEGEAEPVRTGPIAPAATQPRNSGDSPDDILAEMARRRPSKPVSQGEPPQEEGLQAAKSVAPATGAQLGRRRGRMIVNRLVTIAPTPDGDWMEARFVADNTLREQPIRLLPCRMLEIAERLDAETKRRVVKFRVSGWTTTYEGRQYMLLRKAIKVHRIGRF